MINCATHQKWLHCFPFCLLFRSHGAPQRAPRSPSVEELQMAKPSIRLALDADNDRLVAAIIDQQDYERRLHDTRRPGIDMADSYLEYVKANVARGDGALLIAELDGAFAGYAACWIKHDNNVAETDDSNHFGYVADTYVVTEFRG